MREWAVREWSAILNGIALFFLGFLPLVGGPGYEWSLVTGLFVPVVAGVDGAARAQRLFLVRSRANYRTALAVGATRGVVHALLVLGVALVHGARAGFCDPLGDVAVVILGAGIGAVLGGGAGGAFGLLLAPRAEGTSRFGRFRTGVSRVVAGLAAPFGAALVALGEFYGTPAVSLFSAFVGFFAGPLYETVVVPWDRFLTYRLETAVLVAAIVWTAGRCERSATRRIRLLPGGRNETARGLALFGLGLLGLTLGTRLGHRVTAASLRDDLGGRAVAPRGGRARCEVIYQRRAVPRAHAVLLADECEGHLAEFERTFRLRPVDRVTVFLFGDEDEKKAKLGVGRTYVAKPWREEVYLQNVGFPHPVLGHELAHVALGTAGRGPFRIAGSLGGLWPDPGRIEGFAVALSPREDTDASLAEWARAMLDLKRLPPLASLFRMSFFGESGARSYMGSGAFVDFVRRTRGPELLLAWYGGDDLTSLTGKSWAELEAEWHASLAHETPSSEVLAESAERFSAPAVIERRCPHAAERWEAEAGALCGRDAEAALDAAQRALALDPSRGELEALAPHCLLATGKWHDAFVEAEHAAERLAFAPWTRRDLHVVRGDAALRLGDVDAARRAYTRALAETPSRLGRRPIEVKAWATDQPEDVRRVVAELLIGPAEDGGGGSAEQDLGAWQEREPENDFAAYLLGKSLLAARMPVRALPHLERAAGARLPTASLELEARRSFVFAAVEAGDEPAAQRALDVMRTSGSNPQRLREAELVFVRRFGAVSPEAR